MAERNRKWDRQIEADSASGALDFLLKEVDEDIDQAKNLFVQRMNSSTTLKFREMFAALPGDVQKGARKAYRLWKENPRHPSLQFKKVGKAWSVRINDNFRVLAKVDGGTASLVLDRSPCRV